MCALETQQHDEFFDSLLGDFLDESAQLLDRLNENLLQLDQWVSSLGENLDQRCDDELMNDMFRSAHSLKGLSAMLGLSQINELTHKVENVFDAARKDQLRLSSDHVELLFQSVDCLLGLVESLKDPEHAEVQTESVLGGIQRVLVNAGVERIQTSQADAEAALQLVTSPAEPTTIAANHNSPPPDAALANVEPLPASTSERQATSVEPVAPTSEADTPSDTNSVADFSKPASELPAELAIDHFAGITDATDVPAKYMSIFIDETELSLDTLTESLLGQECGRAATENLLIVSHRIKGSAAAVGLNTAAKLAHYMEDLLQGMREHDTSLTEETADALFKCSDALRNYVAGLRQGESRCEGFNSLVHELLRAQLASEAARAETRNSRSAERSPQAASAVASLDDIAAQAPSDISGFVGHVWFESSFPLVGLKARLIYEKLTNLGHVFHAHPPVAELEDLEDLDVFTFGLHTEANEAMLAQAMRISGVQRTQIQPLVEERESHPSESATNGTIDLSLSPELVKAEHSDPSQAEAEAQPDAEALLPTASPPVASTNGAAVVSDTNKRNEPAADNRPAETLRVDIERLDQLMNLAGQLVINKARFTQIGQGLRNLSTGKQTRQFVGRMTALLPRLAMLSQRGSESRELQAELEYLATMARRMQCDLPAVEQEMENVGRVRSAMAELGESVHQLDRIADGIQKSVMETRMVPIGPLFGRFRRVVRDITRGNGKQIDLIIGGEKTELDKRMIDELGDPLIHMVRNSADHGVESPADRRAAGKPPVGTISLNAFHRGNSIIIQVSDDGRGLDADKIRKKAIEKQIVSEADAEKLTPHQIYQLIWEPGFSTAEKVTEVSGRGMGMDIVKSKIEGISGTVETDSIPGQGTTFTIKLPLTLAILPSLLARIDGDVFALPIEAVSEIVRVPADELSTVHNQRTATVRGRVISVVELVEVFFWNRPGSGHDHDTDDKILVIVTSEGREIGLVVDHLLGEEDVVIKSMAENFRNVPGIAGASILGNGRVSLILDIATVIEMAAKRSAPQVTIEAS